MGQCGTCVVPEGSNLLPPQLARLLAVDLGCRWQCLCAVICILLAHASHAVWHARNRRTNLLACGPALHCALPQRQRLCMDDFEPLKLIGKGAFGEVRICRDRSTGKLVAVKKLRKAEMVRRGQVSGATHDRALPAPQLRNAWKQTGFYCCSFHIAPGLPYH